jgi:hypothetical protein
MLKMTISNWKKRIDRQFDANLFDNITVHQALKTKEICNFEYCLQPEVLSQLVAAPIEEEIKERNFVINRSISVANYLIDDVNSRQAAFVNNYDGADNHCVSYFHHYIRDNKHSMNIYVRSLNYDSNFVFDNQTFNLAYQSAFNIVKEKYKNIEQGFIRVFVFSMHTYE